MQFPPLDLDIKIRVIDDPALLKQWNHKEPCIEIYGDIGSCLIPASRVSIERIRSEIHGLKIAQIKWILDFLFGIIQMSHNIRNYQIKVESGS